MYWDSFGSGGRGSGVALDVEWEEKGKFVPLVYIICGDDELFKHTWRVDFALRHHELHAS